MDHGVRVMIRESCISSGQCLSRSHLLEASQLDDRILRQCIKFSRVSCKCRRRSGDALSCPDLRYEFHDLNRDQWCHRDHGHDTEGIRHDITTHGDAGPWASGSRKAAVIGPDATPPESKAIAVYSFGTKKEMPSAMP